jgi:uncharacterized membrane protein
MKLLKQVLPLIFVLVLSLVSIIPFFHSGFFPIHDNTQVQRIFEMTRSLRDGMFPVRWVADLGFGYGYPIFNFYAPFAYYLGSFFNILGLDLLFSTKLMMSLGIILSGFSMYFLAKEIWGKSGGIISALLYVFAPYHAVNVYVRGDAAEFWAYTFIPLIFYSLLEIYKTGKFRFVVIGALSFAALIISHNLTAMMAAPFILVFSILLFLLGKKNRGELFLTIVLGVLVPAFYWLPALSEISYTNVLSLVGGGADYKDHFVCLSQLWSSPWGFGGSVGGCVDGLSFMIGKLHIILLLISIALIAISWKTKGGIAKDKKYLLAFTLLGLIFSIFLTLDYSKIIWDFLKPMALFQYPWRFLLMIGFFISLISGSLLYYWPMIFKNKWVNISVLIALSLVIVVFNGKYFAAQKYLALSSNDLTNDYFLKFRTSQISSEYMPKNFQKPESYNQIPAGIIIEKGNVSIKSQDKKTGRYVINYSAYSDSEILVPIAYFPAWKVRLDGRSYSYRAENNGLRVNLPKGNHSLEFNFRETGIELFSNALSLAGILLLVIGIIPKKKNI